MDMDKYLNISIIGDDITGHKDNEEQCRYRFLCGNRFTTESEMSMAVSYVVQYYGYNEYAKLDRNDSSERIIIFGINGLLQEHYRENSRVHFFRWEIAENKIIPYSEFAMFAIFTNEDFEEMDNNVNEYIQNREYVEFEDHNRDNPWLRLIAIKKKESL